MSAPPGLDAHDEVLLSRELDQLLLHLRGLILVRKLLTDRFMDEIALKDPENLDEAAETRFAIDTAKLLDLYGVVLDNRDDQTLRKVAELRGDVSGMLTVARRWGVAARASHNESWRISSFAAVLASRGLFVLSWRPEDADRVFPSKDELGGLLAVADSGQWLAQRCALIPAWAVG